MTERSFQKNVGFWVSLSIPTYQVKQLYFLICLINLVSIKDSI